LALAGAGYWALGAGVLAGRAMDAAGTLVATRWKPALAWPGRAALGLLRYGIHVTLASLFWFVYQNADYAVPAAWLGPVALGYYALAFQLIPLPVQKLTAHVNHVMFTVFCKIQNDPGRVRDWFLRLTALTSFLATPALCGLALVAEDALPLVLGERWRPAVLPF